MLHNQIWLQIWYFWPIIACIGRKICFGRYTVRRKFCRNCFTVITAEISAENAGCYADGRTLICGNLWLSYQIWHRSIPEGLDASLTAARVVRGMSESSSSNPGPYLMSSGTSVIICAFSFKHATDVLWNFQTHTRKRHPGVSNITHAYPDLPWYTAIQVWPE